MSTKRILHRSKRFLKAFQKLPKPIQLKAIKRIQLFLNDPQNPLLNIHKLYGNLEGKSSFNITGDYRAWFTEEKDDKKHEITFLHIGSHSQLY